MTADDDTSTPLELIEPVGDAACWAAQLCPECGAMHEGPAAACWRCGAIPGEGDR